MISEEQLHRLLQGTHGAEAVTIADTSLRNALAGSLQFTFLVMLAVTLGIVVLAIVLPRQGLGSRIDALSPKVTDDAIPQNLH
jgi:hypothetical protein